jgi:hypothetical protein
MTEEKKTTKNGVSYTVLDCTLSEFADEILKGSPTEKIFQNTRYMVYRVYENDYLNLERFLRSVRSKSMRTAVYAERKTEPEGRIESKVCYDKDTCEDVPENFSQQFVGAYMVDPKNREHFVKLNKIVTSVAVSELKATILLQDLRIQVETHCQTLGQLSVAELRKLMERVLEASRLAPDFKTQLLKKLRTMNKTLICRWLSHQGEIKIDEVPDLFLDPILFHIMLDPVILPNGTTIDRKSYVYIMGPNGTKRNPFTREPLDPRYQPPPNLFAKEMISDFIKDYGIDTRA